MGRLTRFPICDPQDILKFNPSFVFLSVFLSAFFSLSVLLPAFFSLSVLLPAFFSLFLFLPLPVKPDQLGKSLLDRKSVV